MRTSTRLLAITGAAALALTTGLAGIVVGAGLPAPAAPAAQAPGAAQPPAADISDIDLASLSQALAPDVAADPAAAARLAALRQRLAGLRGRNLVHAEVTVDRNGTLVTLDVDHGTITAVGSGSLTIKQAGGGSRTIATSDATRVRKDRGKAALTDLATGDEVFVLGKVDGGKVTATLVVVPALPRTTASSPAPAAP
jgi:hypothetical protein